MASPRNTSRADASPWEKFHAYAKTVPYTLRNPLFHWTHLELKRFFGISKILNGDTAREIWDAANGQLATPEFGVQALLQEPARGRALHHGLPHGPADAPPGDRQGEGAAAGLPDIPARQGAGGHHDATAFKKWVAALAATSGVDCANFAGFIAALTQRHDFFHEMGGRLSDHGLQYCPVEECSETDAAAIYAAALSGKTVSPEEPRGSRPA